MIALYLWAYMMIGGFVSMSVFMNPIINIWTEKNVLPSGRTFGIALLSMIIWPIAMVPSLFNKFVVWATK